MCLDPNGKDVDYNECNIDKPAVKKDEFIFTLQRNNKTHRATQFKEEWEPNPINPNIKIALQVSIYISLWISK